MRPATKTTLSALSVFLSAWLAVKYLLPLIFPFLLGTVLALLAEPAVSFLTSRGKLPRPLGAAVGVTAVFAALTFLLLLAAAFVFRELGMLAGILPDLTETARNGLQALQTWMQGLAAHAPDSLRPLLERNVSALFSGGSAVLDRGFSYVLGLAGTLLSQVPDSALNLGTGVISGFMISARLPGIRKWFRNRIPREKLRPLLRTLRRLRRTLAAWILAQLKLAGVTLVILLVGFLILRIPYAPLWAVGIALVDAFPVLGTGTVLLPWSLILWIQWDRARALGLLGIYAVICVTRSALEPKLLGKHLGLDPLVTLFAIYAGYRIWGIGGMILAPLLAVTAVQLSASRRKPG